MKQDNFYETLKKDIIKTIRNDTNFKGLKFLRNASELIPNNWDLSKPIAIVSIGNINPKKRDDICDNFKIAIDCRIEYHFKPDIKLNDWDSELHMIQAQIIYAIENAKKQDILFSNLPFTIDMDLKSSSVGQTKLLQVDTKIFSKAIAVDYVISCDLFDVIEYDRSIKR